MSGTGDNEPSGEEPALDEQWRAIVDNYGERVELDEPSPASPPSPPPEHAPPSDERPPSSYDEERFVPPPPPPLPRPEPRRALAWAGLFGVPAGVLLALMLQIDLPKAIDYLFIGWFVGGFAYLIATMPRAPRDPWDDGSRV